MQLEQATAMVSRTERVMAARRWEAAAGGVTAVAVMGKHGAERAVGPWPAGEAGLEAATGVGTATATVEATEGERQAGEATMPAAAATAAMVPVAAAMTAMAPVEGTPEVGYFPGEVSSPEAKNGRTRPAAPRWTTSTGSPAGAEPAEPAAARSRPAARRTPPPPPAAAGAGRDPRARSPSTPPPGRSSTAAATRARAGRGSAGPRRRPDLPPEARSRQLSAPRRRTPTRVPRGSDRRRLKIQASPRERRRRRAPDHAALDRGRPRMGAAPATDRSSHQLQPPRMPRSEPPPAAASPPAQCSAMQQQQQLACLPQQLRRARAPLASPVRLPA